MVGELALALMMLTFLIVKHFALDFPIQTQTPWMFMNKGIYGHPGGKAHALIQAAGSLPIYLIGYLCGMPLDWLMAGAVCLFAFEAIVHYHMDWFKIWMNNRKGYTTDTPQFWTLLGLDQLVHYLTYIVMVGFLAYY